MGVKLNPFTGKLDVVDSPSGDFSTVELNQGTQTNPSIVFDGDPNTGIYSPGADQLAISTSGTGRLFIDSSGRVGIDTASPNGSLDVRGNIYSLGTDNTSNRSLYLGNADFASSTRYLAISWNHTSSAAEYYTQGAFPHVFYTNNTERARIDSSGNVGIGTSSPNAEFQVGGSGVQGEIRLNTTGVDHPYLSMYQYGGGTTDETVRIDAGGTSHFTGGNVGIGTQSPSSVLTVNGDTGLIVHPTSASAAGLISIRGTRASGASAVAVVNLKAIPENPAGNSDASALAVETRANGGAISEAARIDSSGNVGIGTTSPGALLHLSSTNEASLLVKNTASSGPNAPQLQLQNDAGHGLSIEVGRSGVGGFTTIDYSAGSTLSNHLAFTNDAGEVMRLDGSSRLLVGTSSTVTGSSDSKLELIQDGSGAPAHLTLGNSNTTPTTGEGIGMIRFYGKAGGVYEEGARITARYDASPGSGDKPCRLEFSTSADGSSSPTERLRIDSSGRVGIGTTSPGAALDVRARDLHLGATSGGAGLITFRRNSGAQYGYFGWDAGSDTVMRWGNDSGSGRLAFNTSGTEKARIDENGRLLVGTSSSVGDDNNLQVVGSTADASSATFWRSSSDVGNPSINFVKTRGSVASPSIVSSGDTLGHIRFNGHDGASHNSRAVEIKAVVDGTPGVNDMPGRLIFSTTSDGASSPTERMRIRNNGEVWIGTTSGAFSATGNVFFGNGQANHVVSGDAVSFYKRLVDDGVLIYFYQDGTAEGSISVSGSTVSYNGAHLARWSQLPGGAERTEILRGSVLSNINEMCDWGEEENEQLNRMKVSDVEGDKNVSGVFQAWDDDDDTYTNDFYCAMTGDFIIRIAQGVTVERGDLLMSAGDGTAKPQDDDIIRSKTIAKVTSTNVSCTYDDGSYCVPCVLMAC